MVRSRAALASACVETLHKRPLLSLMAPRTCDAEAEAEIKRQNNSCSA